MRRISILIIILSLQSCAYKDIAQISIVSAIGIDWLAQESKYLVTFEFSSAAQSKSEEVKGNAFTIVGDNMHDVFMQADIRIPGNIYINHCGLIVLGNDLAKKGVHNIMDFWMREFLRQVTATVVVVNDGTAQSVLELEPNSAPTISSEILSIVDSAKRDYSETDNISAYVFYNNILKNSVSTLPSISLNHQQIATSDGLMIFDADTAIGHLNPRQAFFYMCLENNAKRGFIQSSKSFMPDNFFIARTMRIDTNRKVGYFRDKPYVKFDVKCKAILSEIKGEQRDITKEQIVTQMQDQLANTFKADLLEVLTKTREFGDVFGFNTDFAGLFGRTDSNIDIRDVELDVNVEVILDGSGFLVLNHNGGKYEE